jgi:hypothetical protein
VKYSTDISSTPPAIIETSAQASLAKVAGVLVLVEEYDGVVTAGRRRD